LCQNNKPIFIVSASGKFGTGFDFKDCLARALIIAGNWKPGLGNIDFLL